MPPSNNQEKKVDIIAAVQTPLGLCALIVLIVEGILLAIALTLSGTNLTILVIGMVASLLLMILAVGYAIIKNPSLLTSQRQESQQTPASPQAVIKHDVFISSPMAAFPTEAEYQAARKDVLQVIEVLRKACEYQNVFYAARDIETLADFDAADISLQEDLKAVEESRYFILIYPAKVTSSSLFEAGYALALGKPSLYFVRNRNDLPFLMRQAEQALDTVKIYDYVDITAVTKLICKHEHKLFEGKSE